MKLNKVKSIINDYNDLKAKIYDKIKIAGISQPAYIIERIELSGENLILSVKIIHYDTTTTEYGTLSIGVKEL